MVSSAVEVALKMSFSLSQKYGERIAHYFYHLLIHIMERPLEL